MGYVAFLSVLLSNLKLSVRKDHPFFEGWSNLEKWIVL